jgi:two-component system, NarL family, response regulator
MAKTVATVQPKAKSGAAGAGFDPAVDHHNTKNRNNSADNRARRSRSKSGAALPNIQEPPLLPETGKTDCFTLLIADDHAIVREGLISLVSRQPDMRVVAEASNGREAAEKFFSLQPDVALLDLRMPVMDGVEAVAAICDKMPGARLIILTSYQTEEDVYRALRVGAQAYLFKDSPAEELVRCIRAVAGGQSWIPPGVGVQLAKRVADRDLTPREMDVLRVLAMGKSNKEIGAAFDISEATVKVHVTHILEKLKVTERTEAMNVAIKRGLIRVDTLSAA